MLSGSILLYYDYVARVFEFFRWCFTTMKPTAFKKIIAFLSFIAKAVVHFVNYFTVKFNSLLHNGSLQQCYKILHVNSLFKFKCCNNPSFPFFSNLESHYSLWNKKSKQKAVSDITVALPRIEIVR